MEPRRVGVICLGSVRLASGDPHKYLSPAHQECCAPFSSLSCGLAGTSRDGCSVVRSLRATLKVFLPVFNLWGNSFIYLFFLVFSLLAETRMRRLIPLSRHEPKDERQLASPALNCKLVLTIGKASFICSIQTREWCQHESTRLYFTEYWATASPVVSASELCTFMLLLPDHWKLYLKDN